MLRSPALPTTRLPTLFAAALSAWIALLTSSCAPPASSAAPCNDDSDCSAEEHCEQGRCRAGAPLMEPLADGGLVRDAGAPVDASGDSGADGRDAGGPLPSLDAGSDDDASVPLDASLPSVDGRDDAGGDAGVVCSGPDEDGDGLPNACDNCPSVPNPLQLDDGESQSGAAPDGVGDACDPRPSLPGDSIVLVDGFDDAAATLGVSTSCTWTVSNGAVVQSEGAGGKNCRFSFPSISSADVVVETRMTLLTLEDTSGNAGVMFSQVALDGWLCSLHISDELVAFRVNDGTATSRGRTPIPVTLGTEVRLAGGGAGPKQIACLTDSGGFLYFNVPGSRPDGAVALRTNDATASFAYIVVYQLGGDIVVPSSEAPVHRYSFEGADADDVVTLDSIGAAHGQHKGDAYESGGSVVIDGSSNGYVDLPNGLLSSLSAVTLEAWVTWNGNAAGNWQHLLDFGTSSVGELTDVEDPDAGLVYHGEGVPTLIVVPQTNAEQSLVRLRDQDGVDVFQLTAEPLPTGRPVQFAISYDPGAGVAVFYIDGGERQRRAGSMPLAELDDVNNWIGRSGWSNDSRFDGAVDEVRIYDRALSPLQVMGSFQGGPKATF